MSFFERGIPDWDLTAVLQKDQDWYIGYIKQAPNVFTQERTIDELCSSLVKLLLAVPELTDYADWTYAKNNNNNLHNAELEKDFSLA